MAVMLTATITIHLCFLAAIPGIDNSAFLYNAKNDKLENAYCKVGLNTHTCTALELCSINTVQLNLNLNLKKA